MISKGIYRHFKGGIYEVIGVAIHTETQDGLVLYRDYENPDSITWARPVSMWNDMVNGKKRFELIEAEGRVCDSCKHNDFPDGDGACLACCEYYDCQYKEKRDSVAE